MQRTWDQLAGMPDRYVGPPERARDELDSLFGRLGGAPPADSACLEIGCGVGRMTVHLAQRFRRVVGVDVSPAMLERAREKLAGRRNVKLLLASGPRLDGLPDATFDVVVSYLVLQHLPRRALVEAQLREIARLLAPSGEAFVQLPVYRSGLRPALWRLFRRAVVPLVARLSREPEQQTAYRGTRLTEREFATAVRDAGLTVTADDEGPSHYRYARDLFVRLRART